MKPDTHSIACAHVSAHGRDTESCTLFQELRFVRDPFLRPEGWQDKDPSEWVHAYDYGGNRTPIRLEVGKASLSFLTLKHVYRARTPSYNCARKNPRIDVAGLHARAVCHVIEEDGCVEGPL